MVTDPVLAVINNSGGNPEADESLKGVSSVLNISETVLGYKTVDLLPVCRFPACSFLFVQKDLFKLWKKLNIHVSYLVWITQRSCSALLPGSLDKQGVRRLCKW